jgi:methylated-DNA-protein-cysteine methyltransferase-like protein
MPDSFTTRIVEVIKRIPAGRVATYGQIAAMAGDPRATRQVVWVLRSLSDKENLPWHRVINSKGAISLTGEGYDAQRRTLEAEGVRFSDDGRVPLELFQWRG